MSLWELKNKTETYCSFNNFERPIFVISPPRSGSTFLFKCLAQFDELYHIDWEGDRFWWYNFPYERLNEPSDWVGPEEATPLKQRTLRRQLYKTAVGIRFKEQSRWFKFPYQFGLKNIRYLDKTIANCFHLEFIEKTFPGAQYIFLVRDPCANISSMIEGWPYLEKFGKPQLTPVLQSLDATTIRHWTYPAPPNWGDIVSKPLPEICAWSWQQHIEYPLSFFEQFGRSEDVIWIRYEELLKDVPGTIKQLAYKLDLEFSVKVRDYLLSPPLTHTTVSEPYPNKWVEKNYDAIISVLPLISDTAKKLGYELPV